MKMRISESTLKDEVKYLDGKELMEKEWTSYRVIGQA